LYLNVNDCNIKCNLSTAYLLSSKRGCEREQLLGSPH